MLNPTRLTESSPQSQFLMASVLVLACCGCSKNATSPSASSALQSQSTIDYTKYSKTQTVCSPLAGSGGAGTVSSGPSIGPTLAAVSGLAGRLYALKPGSPLPQNLQQLFANSTDQNVNVFLNDVNVPTRLFNEGFPAADGHLLTDSTGQTLVEYFGLDLSSGLQLGPQDTPGDYQLALLADDGALLSLENGSPNNLITWIDNDGLHPTRMGCATQPLNFQPGQNIPIRLQYFQGPRYEIALTLMWRHWPTNGQCTSDPLCGTTGNYAFFNPDKASAPEQNYIDLLTRGWLPIAPINYVIPNLGFNPCSVPNYFAQ